jgi:alanyl-tRNA synthetase
LRFDFAHGEPMSKEQIAEGRAPGERANPRDLPVTMVIMDLEAAKASGATAFSA